MPRFKPQTYSRSQTGIRSVPNIWDAISLLLVFGVFALLAWGALQMTAPYQVGQQIKIHLSVDYLPYYALRSVLRMFIALICSLVFTFTVGTWAAKSSSAARVIIPLIDVLQSAPVLGYLSISIVVFIALFPNSILGPECAAILAIFTAQVWNMVLSFYQSLRTVPHDLHEAADVFRLSAWQRFWRIEVPFAMPGLLWNTMMSMSASWFFVVAAEAIPIANQKIMLPGIGSYIYFAIQDKNMHAVIYSIITMLVVILLYDQLLFRPLSQWSAKFKFEQVASEEESHAWLISLFQRTTFIRQYSEFASNVWDAFVNIKLFQKRDMQLNKAIKPLMRKSLSWFYTLVLLFLVGSAIIILGGFIVRNVTLDEVLHVVFLGSVTGLRVIVLVFLSALIWIPVGVWIGMRPRIANYMQPVIQFFAAFPVNLVYPIVVIVIVKYHLDANIWISPLMVLGTQWYILFNVIAGTTALPKDMRQAVDTLNVRGWLWWKRFVLPGIFPYIVTGMITAAGGAWNASIVAEVVSWGNTKLEATGLGAYISHFTFTGNFPKQALGIVVMCLFVLVLNRVLWRPLYNMAETRYRL